MKILKSIFILISFILLSDYSIAQPGLHKNLSANWPYAYQMNGVGCEWGVNANYLEVDLRIWFEHNNFSSKDDVYIQWSFESSGLEIASGVVGPYNDTNTETRFYPGIGTLYTNSTRVAADYDSYCGQIGDAFPFDIALKIVTLNSNGKYSLYPRGEATGFIYPYNPNLGVFPNNFTNTGSNPDPMIIEKYKVFCCGEDNSTIAFENENMNELSAPESNDYNILLNDQENITSFKGMYPNPATDVVWLEFSHLTNPKDVKVQIINLNGQLIKESQLDHSLKIDLNDIETGVYLIKVNTVDKQYIHKISVL